MIYYVILGWYPFMGGYNPSYSLLAYSSCNYNIPSWHFWVDVPFAKVGKAGYVGSLEGTLLSIQNQIYLAISHLQHPNAGNQGPIPWVFSSSHISKYLLDLVALAFLTALGLVGWSPKKQKYDKLADPPKPHKKWKTEYLQWYFQVENGSTKGSSILIGIP